MNVLTKEEVTSALKEQKETGEKLGMILVNSGYIDKATLVKYLTLQSQSLVNNLENDIDDADDLLSRSRR